MSAYCSCGPTKRIEAFNGLGEPYCKQCGYWISAEEDAAREESGTNPSRAIHAEPTIGRNDNCPCRSGKKFKKCCGSKTPAATPSPTNT
jgi:hypothetical protein